MKEAHHDVHSKVLYSIRGLATVCWLGAYCDFGCNRCEQKPFVSSYFQRRYLQLTGLFPLNFSKSKEKVSFNFVERRHGAAVGRGVFISFVARWYPKDNASGQEYV